jgi:hypothetical protein
VHQVRHCPQPNPRGRPDRPPRGPTGLDLGRRIGRRGRNGNDQTSLNVGHGGLIRKLSGPRCDASAATASMWVATSRRPEIVGGTDASMPTGRPPDRRRSFRGPATLDSSGLRHGDVHTHGLRSRLPPDAGMPNRPSQRSVVPRGRRRSLPRSNGSSRRGRVWLASAIVDGGQSRRGNLVA